MLAQRDRDLLRMFLDSMCHQLTKDSGGVTLASVSEVASALMLDADGLWVDLATSEANAADDFAPHSCETVVQYRLRDSARAKVGSGLRGLLDDAEAHRDRLRAELLKLARAVVVAQQQFAEPPVDLAESILDSHARGEL